MPPEIETDGLIGDSEAQRAAEGKMIQSFAQRYPFKFVTSKRDLPLAGISVELDGYGAGAGKVVLVEAFARLSKPKSGQKRKILTDALKLLFVSQRLKETETTPTDFECHLLFLSQDVLDSVTRDNWASAALKHFKIKLHVVTIPKEFQDRVRVAETNQAKNQAGKRPKRKSS